MPSFQCCAHSTRQHSSLTSSVSHSPFTLSSTPITSHSQTAPLEHVQARPFSTLPTSTIPNPPLNPHRPHILRPLIHTARNLPNNGRCGSACDTDPLREHHLDRIPTSLRFHTAQNLPNNGRCGSSYIAGPLREGLPQDTLHIITFASA